MTAERVLLTGATGFVGRHLARALVARGTEVVALGRPGSERQAPPGVLTVPVPPSAPGLEAAVRDARPAVCVHLATHFLASHTPDDVVPLVEANVLFGARLAEALVGVGGVPLVDVGSVWQHVGSAPYAPANLYAATKQALADLLTAYALRQGLPVVRLTLTDTYGPDDDRPRLVPLLVAATATGDDVALSSGTQLVDLVHIADVVAAFELVIDRLAAPTDPLVPAPDGSTRFGVSSGAPVTIRELVATLDQVAPRPVAAQWGARPDRELEMREPWDAGPPVPGWRPEVALAAGLAALVHGGPAEAVDYPRTPATTDLGDV
jgi:nucleoside-diphosphate-sugar epimerase